MKKFKFRLEKLLDIRIAREEVVQNELARAVGLQNIKKVEQEKLRDKITYEKKDYRRKLKLGSFSGREAIMFEKYVDISLRAIEVSEQKIQEMEPEIENIRHKLIEVSRERKIVEKLKEKKLEEFKYELEREMIKEADDINMKIHASRHAATI